MSEHDIEQDEDVEAHAKRFHQNESEQPDPNVAVDTPKEGGREEEQQDDDVEAHAKRFHQNDSEQPDPNVDVDTPK